MASSCAAIVIAGGRSRRLGQDKRRLRLWGAAGPLLLERIVAQLTTVCSECIVVLNDAADWQQLPARLIPDSEPGSGPLGALISALRAVQADTALVCAADMPCLAPALLQALVGWPGDGLICASDGRQPLYPQPLLARYPRRLLPTLEAAFAGGERRLQQIVAALPHALLPDSSWSAADPRRFSLINLNTADDLRLAESIIDVDR